MSYLVRAFAALSLLLSLSAPASATSFSFSYLLTTGNTVTGVLDGTLASDKNTVNITGIESMAINGVALTEALGVASTDAVFGVNQNATPTLKLDESYIDFLVYDANKNVFGFAVGDGASSYYGNLAGGTTAFGGDNNYEAYNASNYSVQKVQASQTSPVPEPATWGMMILGFGMIGFALRSRRTATLAY